MPACRARKISNRHLAVASAAMPASAAVRKTVAPAVVRETVAPAAMIPVAMIPAMVPAAPAAIIKIERTIDRIVGVSVVDVTTSLRRASGQGQTHDDQEQYSPRHDSAAFHRSLRFLLHIACTRTHVAIGHLHPVVDVHVVHCSAVSLGQYASTSHLLVVRREGARMGVRLAGWAFERHLKRVTGQAERRSSLAADGIKLTIGHSVECLNMWSVLCGEDSDRPFHVTVIRP